LILGMSTLAGWWMWVSEKQEEAAHIHEKATARTEALTKSFVARMQQDGLVFTPEEVTLIREQVIFANQLSEKRAFSWTRLLTDLEQSLPPNVSLGSIKPNFQDETVSVDGVAGRLQDLNAFIQTLQAHRGFQQAVIAKHDIHRDEPHRARLRPVSDDVSLEGERGQHIEFSLVVRYRPAF
jgi:hypothetical protein